MDASDLIKIAERSRSMRESGIALLLGSLVLGSLCFVPLSMNAPTTEVPVSEIHPDAFREVTLQAAAGVIYDLSTETVLYSKNEEVQLPLASLTKILAVVGALSELDPHTLIVITKDDTRGEYSNNLAVGDTFTLSDLARLTLTGSLNDGATAIARMASSKVEGNVPRMLGNVSAALNLSETYAVNGNGLDVSGYVSGGYGSALDMAKLSGALVRLAPDIAAATSQTSVKATTKDGKVYTISNTNPKVHTIPGILFSKTGYTSLAGGNLSLVIDVGIDHPVAIVVLGSTEKGRFQDSDTLLKATFSHFADLESL